MPGKQQQRDAAIVVIAAMFATSAALAAPLPKTMVPYEWLDDQRLAESIGIDVPVGTTKRLAQAAVTYNYFGSGVFVAPGVVLTAGHVVDALFSKFMPDLVHAIQGERSADWKRALGSGFAAESQKDELPLPAIEVRVSTGVKDVTSEVTPRLERETTLSGRERATQELTSLFERPGEVTQLIPRWKGAAWYAHTYQPYTDVRLILRAGRRNFWNDYGFLRVYGDDAAIPKTPVVPLLDDQEPAGTHGLGVAFPIKTARETSSAERLRHQKYAQFVSSLEASKAAWWASDRQFLTSLIPAGGVRYASELDWAEKDEKVFERLSGLDEQMKLHDREAFEEQERLNRTISDYQQILTLGERIYAFINSGLLGQRLSLASWALDPGDGGTKVESGPIVGLVPLNRADEMAQSEKTTAAQLLRRAQLARQTEWFLNQLKGLPTVGPWVEKLLGSDDASTFSERLAQQTAWWLDRRDILRKYRPSAVYDVLASSDSPVEKFALEFTKYVAELERQHDIDLGRLAKVDARLGKMFLTHKNEQYVPEADATMRASIFPLASIQKPKDKGAARFVKEIEIDGTEGSSGGPLFVFVENEKSASPAVLGVLASVSSERIGHYASADRVNMTWAKAIRREVAASKAQYLLHELGVKVHGKAR